MHMARSTYYFEINKNNVVAECNQKILEEIKDIKKKDSYIIKIEDIDNP